MLGSGALRAIRELLAAYGALQAGFPELMFTKEEEPRGKPPIAR